MQKIKVQKRESILKFVVFTSITASSFLFPSFELLKQLYLRR